jgi:hypothetical protein
VADLNVWEDEDINVEREAAREYKDDFGHGHRDNRANNKQAEYEKLRHAPPGLVADQPALGCDSARAMIVDSNGRAVPPTRR